VFRWRKNAFTIRFGQSLPSQVEENPARRAATVSVGKEHPTTGFNALYFGEQCQSRFGPDDFNDRCDLSDRLCVRFLQSLGDELCGVVCGTLVH
jgi:hypothetical protein